MKKEEIFELEKKRLEEVIKEINRQIKENEDNFNSQEHFIIGFKEGMRGTQFNRQSMMSFYATEIHKLKSIIDNPYFGRFNFIDHNNQEHIVYIGKKAINGSYNHPIAYDWRSNICSMYYDYNIGPAEYDTGSEIEKGEITSKRQIVIKKGQLEDVSETDTITDDSILLKYLNDTSDARLKSIIATIGREQNKIIRSPLNNNYIVSGVAGSGKTTVALHRIAYLLYNEARNINEADYMILGPNKYFLDYISALLPDLDISHVASTTYEELAMNNLNIKVKLESKNTNLENILNNKYNKKIATYKSSISYLKLIENFISYYVNSHIQEDITYEGITLCNKEKIINYIASNHTDTYANKINTLIKAITKQIKDRSDELSHKIWLQYRDEFISLSKDNPRRKEILDKTDFIQKEIKKGCPNILKEYFKFIKVNPLFLYNSFIENIDTLTNNEIVSSLKDVSLKKITKKQIESNDIAPLLLINYLINGIKDYENYEHLVIDEAQDLSLADYYILRKICPKANFDIYGDISQAIYGYSGINDWQILNSEIFNGTASILDLNKSYRTTKEISDTANLILDYIGEKTTECVARNGNNISVNDTIDNKTILSELKTLLDKEYGSIAIICKDGSESKKVYIELTKLGINANLITNDDEKYAGGVSILPSYLAKGLEFDAVIIYNANDINYSDDSTNQKLLYVAITRAMHDLYINYKGTISKSLNNLTKQVSNTKRLIK